MSFPWSPDALAIHLDAVGGIAGDMFVAAMVDALPELEPHVRDELARVQPPGRPAPAFVLGESAGLSVRRFVADDAQPRVATHDHAHGDGGHGTSYEVLRATIARSGLTEATREQALALLARLGEAEARVHGTDLAHVHFHELADWDSLMDVVAAGTVAARLAGARWSSSALPLGGGTVRTSHGLLPVPTPATVHLLEGYAWRDDGVGGERVTPTGAAILRHLVPSSRCGGDPGSGRLLRAGSGAGTREMQGMPNVLRVLVFDTVTAGQDRIGVIEFDVDDMTGEEIGFACERLRGAAGVVDVSVGTRLGKKGRPVSAFRLLVAPAAVDAVADACFRETSTLGLRVREETRRVLARREVGAGDDGAPMRVKVAQRPGAQRTAKAEHDDLREASGLDARRDARAAAERAAKEK